MNGGEIVEPPTDYLSHADATNINTSDHNVPLELMVPSTTTSKVEGST